MQWPMYVLFLGIGMALAGLPLGYRVLFGFGAGVLALWLGGAPMQRIVSALTGG